MTLPLVRTIKSPDEIAPSNTLTSGGMAAQWGDDPGVARGAFPSSSVSDLASMIEEEQLKTLPIAARSGIRKSSWKSIE